MSTFNKTQDSCIIGVFIIYYHSYFFQLSFSITGPIKFERTEGKILKSQTKRATEQKKKKKDPTGKCYLLYGCHKVALNDTLLFILHPGHWAAGWQGSHHPWANTHAYTHAHIHTHIGGHDSVVKSVHQATNWRSSEARCSFMNASPSWLESHWVDCLFRDKVTTLFLFNLLLKFDFLLFKRGGDFKSFSHI